MRIDPLLTRNPVTGAVSHVTDNLLAEVYLAPRAAEFNLRAALGPGTPWSVSLAGAPRETARVVKAGLIAVARATPRLAPSDPHPEALPEGRTRSHLAALRDLWRDLGTLSGPLPVLRHALRSEMRAALEPLLLLGASVLPIASSRPPWFLSCMALIFRVNLGMPLENTVLIAGLRRRGSGVMS